MSKHLADNTKICYTYDSVSRVTNRTVKNECDEVVSSENFTYDTAGNITDATDSCYTYGVNNLLLSFNGESVTYDQDGNMLSAPLTDGRMAMEYDSANRLIKAGDHTYTYNAEDVRIRNLCSDADTTYVYNTNCKLSQLLMKNTNGIVSKYVYGLGLIYEEKFGDIRVYHYDYRGSTVALTNGYGNTTDTFKYDTYGRMIEHTGDGFIIFGYNGRDGVVTDKNGLIYMRARYYSPEMRRFVNADIVPGEISNAITLNRYAYANGNPVSFVDPFGLSAERGSTTVHTINLCYSAPTSYTTYVNLSNVDYSSNYLMTSLKDHCFLHESGKQGPECPPATVKDIELMMLGYCVRCGVKGCCSGDTSVTNISLDGLKFISTYEKFYSKPYDDGYGNMTIGFGHLIGQGERFTEITESQAWALLHDEITQWEQAVIAYSNKLGVEWTQNEFDALVSLAFNSGNNFKSVINDILSGGDPHDEFNDIIKSGGKKSLGLYRRRMDEADIFVYGEYVREDREWP